MQSKRVLIFHAEDASREAIKIKDFLKKKGLIAITLEEAMSEAEPGAPLVSVYEGFINDFSVLIFIPSPKFFPQDFLSLTAQMAIFSEKFFPIILGHKDTVIPMWFSMYTPINFNIDNLFDPWDKLYRDTLYYLDKDNGKSKKTAN